MTDKMDAAGDAVSAREKFRRTLIERAESITCVRNDVFTTKYSQLAINFALGAGSLAALIASMVVKNGTATVWLTAVGLALLVAVIVYNVLLRRSAPKSFLQYSCADKDGKYRFMIFSKTLSAFYDGENYVETDGVECGLREQPCFTEYRFDFFADMDAYMRKAVGDKEIFRGALDSDGKRIKCKIVFKNGVPYVGVVGGARIKYFDVNDASAKFVIPVALKKAAKQLDVPFPKLSSVLLKDARDITKQ
ncbi:MAG: hypothetical protein NC184_06000 [Roseburia sp.]|nr:hypothetical protein [Roseburia sp.]